MRIYKKLMYKYNNTLKLKRLISEKSVTIRNLISNFIINFY